MVNTYSDIAIRPDKAGYPVVSAQKSDAQDAADFERILKETPPSRAAAATSAPPPAMGGYSFLSFLKDILDVINPLQHIPVIGAIYRHITGDEISPMAHLAGDALYGGPIGAAIAVADIAYQKTTGKDMGETVIASLMGNKPAATDTMLAQNLNNGISPAAGDNSDITWATDVGGNAAALAENSSSTDSPLFLPPALRIGTGGEKPADTSASASPVFPPKGTVSTLPPLTASEDVGSTTVLQSQKAPARIARTAVPPELIAAKMMEALDKYGQMRIQPAAPQMSAVY